MRHLLLVEVNADDDIPSETVSKLVNAVLKRGIAERCETHDRADENFAYFRHRGFPKPRQPDIRDLEVGDVKVL